MDITITTTASETIIFKCIKYANVSDKMSGGVHTITLSTGCYSTSGIPRASMLFKIDYWLKTHRKGQTRVSPIN